MSQQPQNQIWMDYVLKAMFHDVTVFRRGCTVLEPDALYTYGISQAQRIIFGIFKKHHSTVDRPPDVDAFTAYLSEAVSLASASSFGTGLPVDVLNDLTRAYQNVITLGSEKPDWAAALQKISEMYDITVAQPKVRELLSSISVSKDYSGVSKEITSLQTKMSAGRAACDPFAKAQAREFKRLTSCEPWLNKLTSGGWRAGLAYGVIAPTGGGKTTLSAQVGVDAAMNGYNVDIIYTEQSMDESEMIDRFWSLITRKPMGMFSKYTDEKDFPADLVSERDREIANDVRKRLNIYDFAKTPGSMDEVRAIAMGATGARRPDLIIVDWAGEFAKQLMATDKRIRQGDEAQALRYVADEYVKICREAYIPGVIFQQLAAAAGTDPTRKYDHTDAANSKQFFYNIANGIVICPKDKNSVTRIDVTKGRYGANTSQIVKLNGACSRFEPLDGYKLGRGRYVKDGESDDADTIPNTDKPRQGPGDGTNPGSMGMDGHLFR